MSSENQDSFEYGEKVSVDVTIRGVTRQYFLQDITKAEADELYAAIGEAGEDRAKVLAANRDLTSRVVTQVVRRADGTAITIEEAGKMRATLVNKLALKALAFISDGDYRAAGEAAIEQEAPEKKD